MSSDRRRDTRSRTWDWDSPQCRAQLDEIFFRKHDYIQAGSTEHRDFWAFFDRFQRFKTKKDMCGARRQGDREEGKDRRKTGTGKITLDLPKEYDARYRINVSVCTGDIEERLGKSEHKSRRSSSGPGSQEISDFRLALLHFLDFSQRQSFGKLSKLRREQRNLPIFQYRDRIVELVRGHPVVVVAGDTGCGKSTQVPQYLISAGFQQIACTQPRRIACISLAKRVSFESLNQYGSQVCLHHEILFVEVLTSVDLCIGMGIDQFIDSVDSALTTWNRMTDVIMFCRLGTRSALRPPGRRPPNCCF